MKAETLPPDVGWEPDGHLSEVALSALADGEEELLDDAMHAHLGSCDACATHLGEVALRSAVVAEAFADVHAHVESLAPAPVRTTLLGRAAARAKAMRSRERGHMPILAIAAALALALLGAAPSMVTAADTAVQTWTVVRKVAPSVVRLLPQAAMRAWNGPKGSMVGLVWGLSAVLVLAGFGIAKKASKKALVDGGRQ